jgi:hypothetical protein
MPAGSEEMKHVVSLRRLLPSTSYNPRRFHPGMTISLAQKLVCHQVVLISFIAGLQAMADAGTPQCQATPVSKDPPNRREPGN